MPQDFKDIVYQDQGPQCCKGEASPENPAAGAACELQDGEPIGALSGTFSDSRQDLLIAGKVPFGITGYYSSDLPYMGHLGYGWSSELGARLFHWPDSTWSLRDPYGRREDFGDTGLSRSSRFYAANLKIANDTASLRVDEKTTWVFDRRDGVLLQVHNDAGYGYTFTYDATPASGTQAHPVTSRLQYPIRGVSDHAVPRGLRATIAMDYRVKTISDKTFPAHAIGLSYDTSGMVASATDHSGRVVRYSYDRSGNLVQVVGVDSSLQRYRFEDPKGIHRVTAFDPLPVGVADTIDPSRLIHNQWDAHGRGMYQIIGGSSGGQTYKFERNPYSMSCYDPPSHGDSWNQTCVYVRSTSVTRTDANGLGGTVNTTRTYVDSVVDLRPVTTKDPQSGATIPVSQTGDQVFRSRVMSETETVNGDAVVYRITFDQENNVISVRRPDGTDISTRGTVGGGSGLVRMGPLVTGLYQRPPASQGRPFLLSRTYDYKGDRSAVVDETDTLNGAPYAFRHHVIRTSDWSVAGDRYVYGPDSSSSRNSYDALGRVDSVFGYNGYVARAWYASASSAKPDSLTYADGSGLRYIRDALDRILSVRDPLGRTSTYRYTTKDDVKLACGPDSLCDRFTWVNQSLVRAEFGSRLLPDGTQTPPIQIFEFTVNGQKRRTHTWRIAGSTRILVQKEVQDAWGNVWATYVNPDTAYADSSQWVKVDTSVYDARGRRISHSSLVNGQFQTTSYTYDKIGHLTSVRDPRGTYTTVTIDAYGNLTSRRDTLGRIWKDSVNERGLPLTETDPAGRVVRHTWNHLGNETQRIGWRNDTSLWIWQHDRLLKSRSPEGRWTTFGYDTLGRLVRATAKVGDTALTPDANDLTTTWAYDKAGNAVSQTVAGRKVHGWLVDGAGKVLADTNALGQATKYIYDNLGRTTGVVGVAGDTLGLAYDSRGAVALGRIGTDTLMQSRSNNLGLPVWLRRPGEGAVTSTFSALGYLQTVKDSAGRSFGFQQDAFGADSAVGNGVGNRQAIRDALGRLQKVLDEKGNATLFAWDNLDRLKSVTTPSGLVTTYTYADSSNGWQRRTTSRTAGTTTKSETHAWDRDGLLRRFTDGRGISALYSYDSLARLTGIAYVKPDGTSAGPAKVFRYTPEGWTRAMVYGNVTDSVTYDGVGRVLKNIQAIGTNSYTTEHRYDDKNRLDTLILPDGIKTWRRVDDRGRTVSVWRNGVRIDTSVWAGSRRASQTLGNGVVASYGYDANGRITSLSYAKGATILTSYSFGYTAAGKLAWQQRNHAPTKSEVYTWTPDGQLDSVVRGQMDANHAIASPTWRQKYAAEASGNWPNVTTTGVAQARTFNGFGELTGVDASVLAWDAGGNLTNDGVQNLTWTPDGRLDSVDGKVKLVYDAMGRLVQRRNVAGASVDMVWDGWREVYSSSTSGETITRLYGNYLDGEDCEIHKTGAAAEIPQYLLAGNNWNTEAVTDASGAITRGYVVDPFGTFAVYTSAGLDGKWFTADDVAGNAATLDGERIFQGLPWYGSTGLYFLRNRWYSPTLERFVSIDPLGFQAGDANLYRFEGNDPLGQLDPMGAKVWTREFAFNAGVTAVRGLGVGTLLGVAVLTATSSPLVMTVAGAFAVAAIANTVIDAIAAGNQIATGTDLYGHPLCPNQLDHLKQGLILEAISFGSGLLSGGGVAGYLGGGAGAAAAEGVEILAGAEDGSGMGGNIGSGVDAGEAESGITPRSEPAPDPTPGVEPGPGTQTGTGADASGKTADVAKPSSNDAFSHGLDYADRVRARGVQDPVSHNFPYTIDDQILSTTPIAKQNGYNIYQMAGTMNGKNGLFEIGVTKDGVIDHRFFRPTK